MKSEELVSVRYANTVLTMGFLKLQKVAPRRCDN